MTAYEIAEGYIRLHIVPLRPELLNTYLGSSLAPLAKNISYHTVQTFPERGFGYLELPAMEAAKLKKKLNGSILKGQKIRIEDAKPEKRKRSADEEDGAEDPEKARKTTRRSVRNKVQDKVFQGYELEKGRKVKRGWTETPVEKRQEREAKKMKSKDKSDRTEKEEKKRKREASKFTGEPECLFRATLPVGIESKETADKKSKKDEKKLHRDVVVHEFSNTKKHASFLKSTAAASDGKTTQEYIDGKGWVDANGIVLEEETEKQREKRERRERRERKKTEKAAKEELREQEEQPTVNKEISSIKRTKKKKEKVEEEEKAKRVEEASKQLDSDASPATEDPVTPRNTLALEDVTPTTTEPPKEIHPLEALYKRPQLSSLDTTPRTPKEPAFSFFGAGDDSDIEAAETVTQNEPQTPFTKQDMEWRGVRSAAPTPDTAAIGRRFSFSVMRHIDIDEEDSDGDSTGKAAEGKTSAVDGLGITNNNPQFGQSEENSQHRNVEQREESEFTKWFFENRSENNKKWRARRREAMKMKRKRENRRLTRRIV